MALDKAIEVATQVGNGLAAAHEAGIVHRDITPANLFVTRSGVVKILDFGLAKLAGTDEITLTGTVFGTVAYMSPEQVRGEDVDHRTDIWSLGVVVFEMLNGQRPFQGTNPLSVADAIRSGRFTASAVRSSSLPGAVRRALEQDRVARYQSVNEFVRDLRIPGPAPGARLVTSPHLPADVPSIAVLPFLNTTADPEQEYFCDGLAEELIATLARVRGLRVVSRTSAFQFKGRTADVREIGRILNVRTVLEGSVRKAGNRIRINAQLIDAADGYHLWSDRYDRAMDDIFIVQDDMASAIVSELEARLLTDREALVTPRTADVDAYQLYLKGRHRLNQRTDSALTDSLSLFEGAIARDPGYAGAYAGLADALTLLGAAGYGSRHADYLSRARVAARKAIELDDRLAEAHEALGFLRFRIDWEWVDAEAELRRAIELRAGSASAHHRLALALIVQGRCDEAVAAISRAVELDPLSLVFNTAKGRILTLARRFDEAVVQLQHTVELDPSFAQVRFDLGMTHAHRHRFDDAVAEFERGLALSGRRTLMVCILGYIYGMAGRSPEALALLDEIRHAASQQQVPPMHLAIVYTGLGAADEAIDALAQAYEAHDGTLVFIQVEPCWDSLRSHARFQEIVRRMNFPSLTQGVDDASGAAH